MSRSLFCLFIANMLMGLSFWILWPLGLAVVQREGWSALGAGTFASFTWATCLFALPFAQRLVLRFGHRRIIATSISIHCVACLGYAEGPPASLWLWAGLLGLSLGLRWPTLDAWTIELVRPTIHGRLLAVIETIAGLPLILGPAITVVVGVDKVQLLGFLALISAAGSAAVAWANDPPVRNPGPRDPRCGRGLSGAWALRHGVLAAALCGGLFESGFMASAPLIAQARGLSLEVGLWSSVMIGIGSVLVQLNLGWAADRLGAMWPLIFCAAGLACAFAALSFVPESIMPLSVLIGGFGGGLYTLVAIYGVQQSIQPSTGAIGQAAATSTLGNLLSPVVTGAALQVAGPVSTLASMSLLSALLGAWLLASYSLDARRRTNSTRTGCRAQYHRDT